MANYSQHEEDQKIEELVLAHKITPFVVDVGAGDGSFLSNSRKFILEYGFRGLMIEPSSEPYADLEKLYLNDPNIETLNVALGEKEGMGYVLERGTMNGTAHWTLDHVIRSDESLFKTRTLSKILEERDIKEVGLLSIDTEGSDEIIIKELIKNSDVRPDIIITEILNENIKGEIMKVLESDYTLAAQVQFNLILLNKRHEKNVS